MVPPAVRFRNENSGPRRRRAERSQKICYTQRDPGDNFLLRMMPYRRSEISRGVVTSAGGVFSPCRFGEAWCRKRMALVRIRDQRRQGELGKGHRSPCRTRRATVGEAQGLCLRRGGGTGLLENLFFQACIALITVPSYPFPILTRLCRSRGGSTRSATRAA